MEEEKLTKIDVKEMALECTTKAEIYKVLVNCGRVYLPPVDQINDDFISDILSGDKLVSPLLNLQVCIIEFFPNGIFTSVGKYSNSVVELPVKKVDLGK